MLVCTFIRLSLICIIILAEPVVPNAMMIGLITVGTITSIFMTRLQMSLYEQAIVTDTLRRLRREINAACARSREQ